MGKFRKRVACKGKRWAKGQSSSSNPEAKTYRNAAKSRFFQVNLGNSSGLTEFAVRKHEVMFGSVKAKPGSLATDMDDDESVAGTSLPGTCKTFETFASDWSNCSNVSFSKLLTTFSNNSSIHKEMLAILAAVTEVIKDKNGTENSTEYFAALMTLLDGAAEGDDYKEESVTAMLSLLSMGIKTVPRPVLQLKFADASKILMILLSKHAASNNNVIMRSLIGCLSVLLRAQDAAVWSQSYTMKVYESILSFCAHSKPKIRKAAQHACCAILKASACNTPSTTNEPSSQSDNDDFPSLQDSNPGVDNVTTASSPHPASSVTAAYVIRNIELNPALGGSTSTLHVLGFLKDVIGCLSKTNIKAVCESILKVMTLGNVIIISSGLETLHSLFLSSPDPVKTLTPQVNAQLINALYDYQPPSSDSQPTQAWLTTLGAAFGNLARIDLALCMSNLTRFMTICTQLWMSDKMEVVNGATHTLQGLLEDCVAKAAATPQSTSQHRTSLKKVFDLLSGGLSYQYNRVWNQVLAVLSLLFKVCGATCADFMSPCLLSLAELRDSHNFPCSNEVDYAIGAAVRSMGVDVVLKQIPYQLGNGPDSAAEEIKRSWLLPVLKANIINASLDLFVDYFLPLATLCRKRSEECRLQNGSSSLAISYNLLQTQIWSLLPAFCHKPRDVSSFPKLAKVLGNVLTSYKDLRLTVMLALRRLMESNPQCPLMRKYAKNYLPILLNIYTTPPRGTDDENVRTATFQTLEMYATCADRDLLTELLTSAVNKIKKAVDEQPSKPSKKSKKKPVVEDKPDEEVKSKEVKFLKASILDVIRVLLPYQHVQDMEELFSFLQETLNTSKDSTEVKKVYRILQELCESDQEGAQAFVKEHMEDVVDILVEPKDSKVATPSHAARLKCLSALLSSMTESQTVNIIPPAVAGIKSVNSACRDHAFMLLTCVAGRMVELNPESGLTSLIDNLSVGLQGVPKLASASILGLASVTHHCRNSLVGTESLSTVISNILVLLTSNTREIVSSCLSFIKLLLTSFHKDDNAPHIPTIVREISAMSHDCKRHFRIKVKDIFVRLLRKYGDDTIFHMIPSHDVAIVKQVKNMIKIRRRKNKDKTKNSESDNEDEEFSVKSKPKTITEILEEIEKDDDQELLGIDDEPKEKVGKQKKKKKAKQFIQENEDEILDFTDMTNMGKISSSKPGASQTGVTNKKPKKDAFKMSEDGRLIITESDSEDETDKKLNKLGKLKIEDDDQEDEEDKEDPRRILAGGKRKRGASEKGSVRSEPASKYQAGGSGIHRPINSSASSVKSFKTNKSNAMNKSNTSTTDVGSAVYKSKKSQGDMKRKGLPDPYAYVPLTRKLLNKRKKNKSTGQFKNIVKGAKKGAKIGKSMKSKDKKKGKK